MMTDTQREAFEHAVEQAYEKPTLTSIERDGDGYMDSYVDNAWWGWQAALAHLAQEPVVIFRKKQYDEDFHDDDQRERALAQNGNVGYDEADVLG